MMNKKIRRLIDDIFSDMKMTADNLALRDELMANAQARFEDSVRQGKSEDEAFAEVASSLGDVQSLLKEMNEQKPEEAAEPDEEEPEIEEKEEPAEEKKPATDLGDALGKAFGALGDMGKQIMPQAQKFVKQVDSLTGGVIGGIGKAVGKGLSDAQKAAGKAIDKLSGDKGEIVIDFGEGAKEEKPKAPAALRERAKDIRAEAEIKQAAGDQEGARQLRAKAYAMETEADEMEKKLEEIVAQEKPEEPESDFDSLKREMDAMNQELDEMNNENEIDLDAVVRDAEEAAKQTDNAKTKVPPMEGHPDTVMMNRFSAEGLQEVLVKLDADDVTVKESSEADTIVVRWESGNDDSVQPNMILADHTLTINRDNPDVFKTFFSVFQKEGGKLTIQVPRGYAADYDIGTTSGDIKLYAIDVNKVKINTTSGSVRVEPDSGIRAKEIGVNSISGSATVSACAEKIDVTTVSGKQFISCDADKVDVSAVSGKVHAEGSCENWEISSVSGNIELICTTVPTDKVEISTVSGNACVTLPNDIQGFTANMNSVSGHIANEFGPNRYGTCALPIHMDTMSGKLTLTKL